MEIVNHGNFELAYGVQWHALDGVGILKTQAEKVARKNAFAAYCYLPPSRRGREALAGGIKKTVGKKVVVAAAHAFASKVQEQTALYIGQTPTGKFVLIGLLNGIPSPSFDIVGSLDSVLSALAEYETHLIQGALLYVQESAIQSSSDLATRVYQHSTILQEVPELPCQLPEDIDVVCIRDLGIAKPVKIAGIFMLLLFIGMGGWYGWEEYAANIAKKEAAAEKARQALAGYLLARDAELASANIQLALPAAQKIWEVIGTKAITRSGWSIRSGECSSGVCALGYTRTPAATFLNFVGTQTDAELPKVTITDLQVGSMLATLADWDKVPTINLDNFVQPKDLAVDFGSRAQLMALGGVRMSFEADKVLGDATMAGQIPKPALPVRRVGNWKASGPADTFVATFKRMPLNLTLSRVNFSVTAQDVTFEASGRYFLK